MFRRTKPDAATADSATQDVAAGDSSTGADGKKGQPTPKRRDAEAASRARAKSSATGKQPTRGKGGDRAARAETSRAIRQGMKDGDERYLPNRDKGPVKRFVRDFIDSRLNMAEFAIPALFVSLVSSGMGQQPVGTAIMNATFLIVVLDCIWLRFRLRRELNARFPSASYKGTTFYAFTRALQFRFLRLPKTQAKIGQKLPDKY